MEEKIFSELERCGVNLSAALQRFMGNKDIYGRVLLTVKKDTSFKNLQQALLEKNYEEAFSHAHTLKGVAGNMGFDSVLKPLAPMVELLRDAGDASSHEEEIEEYMKEVTLAYEAIEKVLDQLDS